MKSDGEASQRRALAACYRLIAHFGLTDLTSTHISARSDNHDRILINRFGLLFHEVRASNLVCVRLDGRPAMPGDGPINPAGYLIHSAIHAARDDAACVIHTHSAAGIAVACQSDGLLPISQHALQFHDRIGYHDYEGIALLDEERGRLVRDLSGHRAMILRNHGLLTVGRSVGEAFVLMHNLERACRIQIAALSGGRPLTAIDPAICELTARQHEGFGAMAAGEPEWSALMRDLDRREPDYAD